MTLDDGRTSVEFRRLDVVRWEVCEVDAAQGGSEDDLADLADFTFCSKLLISFLRTLVISATLIAIFAPTGGSSTRPLRHFCSSYFGADASSCSFIAVN